MKKNRRCWLTMMVVILGWQAVLAQTGDVMERKLAMNLDNIRLDSALYQLTAHSGLGFSYSNDKIPIGEKVNLRGNQSLKAMLDQLCTQYNMTYKLMGQNIVLSPKGESERKVFTSKPTLSGYIKDASTGEALIGAAVYVKEISAGTTTNAYGFYSITLPAGNYTLLVSYIGYTPKELPTTLGQNQTLSLELATDQVQMQEVEIRSTRPDANINEVKMSREILKIDRIKSIPAIFGEVDILKALQLLPGIQSAGEGTTGLFVRGGSADQTLIQLDEAPVYNASHLFGFFSVFNPDAIKDVEIYKGGIPAQFGGRLSSLVDIRMKEGNSKRFSATGGIGLISSRLTLEGPIKKDRASFIVSGRRTYVDVINNLVTRLRTGKKSQVGLYFYDLNAKVNYRINERNTLYLSGYFGRDVLRFDRIFGMNWGNYTTTFRWNHLFSSKLFLNTTVLYSKYDYGIHVESGPQRFDWKSYLEEVNTKLDFNYFLNPNNEIRFGYNVIGHKFSPATITFRESQLDFETFKLDTKYAIEQALYLSNTQKITDKLSLEYGIRYSFFQNIGPGRVFSYRDNIPTDDRAITDTTVYKRLRNINFYHGPEPRIGMKYSVGATSSVKASYNRMRQYMQIASNSTAGLPIDRWVSSDQYIKPQVADQVALGYFRNFRDNMFETSVEVYYKWMQNQIDFKEEAEILLNNNLETELRSGRAWAYGAEFMVRKNSGRLSGWVSYTWSRAQRQIKEINEGKAYSPRYDRPHNVSVVLSYDLSRRISLSGNWVYTTGSAVTFPKGAYEVEGKRINYYEGRNQNRLPNYHRLDLSLTLNGRDRPNRRWKGSWNFSVYNAYSRKNPFTIQFREVYNNDPRINESGELDGEPVEITTKEPKAVKSYLFRFIPSVTYNFKF